MNEPEISTPSPPPARRLSRAAVWAGAAFAVLLLLFMGWSLTVPKKPIVPTPKAGATPPPSRPPRPTFLETPLPPPPAQPPAAAARSLRAEALLSDEESQDDPGPEGSLDSAASPSPSSSSLGEAPSPGVYRPFPGRYPSTSLPPPRPSPPPLERPSRLELAYSSRFETSGRSAQSSVSATAPPSGGVALGSPSAGRPALPPWLNSPPTPPAALLERLQPPPPAAQPTAPNRRGPVNPQGPQALHLLAAEDDSFLPAGTVLDLILLTRVDSTLDGDVVALVTRDVHSPRGRLLLPKGTRLLGSPSNQISPGERRLAIAWNRILLSDRLYSLPNLASSDSDGAAGLRGDVDNHTFAVLGRATLLSLLGAAAQLGQPRSDRTSTTLTDQEIAAGAVSRQLTAAASDYVRRAIDIAPTITVDAGTTFKLVLPFDLVLAGDPR